jgi:SAM-dependent methyltransferase
MTVFKDHFSERSDEYAKYRPDYPPGLFDWLATLAPTRELAWDVGTGNGQAAIGVARYFDRVIASDAAEAQLRHAAAHERVVYRVMPAERTDFASAAVDLITVAQALHWFDFGRFYEEVRRVLKPGAAIVAWTYGLLRVTPAVDAVLKHHYTQTVGAYWPPERRYVDENYRTIPFPFTRIAAPDVPMKQRWRLEDMFGYLGTWSATRRYRQAHGHDPSELIREALARAWGTKEDLEVEWPLYVIAGRV